MTNYMITTIDNPFNPHTHYAEWYAFDETQGYHTEGLLGRVVKTSSEMSEADQDLAVASAIDEIVNENILGIYQKVAAPKAA